MQKEPLSFPGEPLTRADDETRTRDPNLGKVMRYQLRYIRVGDTGIEPVTSSVSGKRATAAPIARAVLRGGDGIRTRVYGFAGRCLASRPLHRSSRATGGPVPRLRADDGIRTRDPHLGKVMLYH